MNADATEKTTCPLCRTASRKLFHTDRQRSYYRCPACALVFVPQPFWLTFDQERTEYDRHENRPDDPGYRRFLSRLVDPMLARLKPGSHGLDFGCGPGPALPAMLEERGHVVSCYDPFYFDEPALLNGQYDFVCATEVVEHLRAPDETFATLFAMLKPGGCLGIMTKLVEDQEAFATWHYIRDPTHICFYSRETFGYIARQYQSELLFAGADVILLHQPEGV